jgi:hypothetical protein
VSLLRTLMSNRMQPSQLDGLSIASPCSADWNQMQGDQRRRFCAQCKLHVHDLSAMSKPEAEQLLAGAATGRVCVRLFRRADGTVLTQDCPVGLRQQLRRTWTRAAALWLAVWAGAGACMRSGASADTTLSAPPVPQHLLSETERRELSGETQTSQSQSPK